MEGISEVSQEDGANQVMITVANRKILETGTSHGIRFVVYRNAFNNTLVVFRVGYDSIPLVELNNEFGREYFASYFFTDKLCEGLLKFPEPESLIGVNLSPPTGFTEPGNCPLLSRDEYMKHIEKISGMILKHKMKAQLRGK